MASFINPDLNKLEHSSDGDIEYKPIFPFIQNESYTATGKKWYVKYLLFPLYLPFSPFVIFLRIVIALPLLFFLGLICFTLNIGADSTKPFDRTRVILLALLATPIIRIILFTMGYCVIIRNSKRRVKCHAIVANHTDFMDVLCMYCAESTSYVSKEAVTRFWPIKAIAVATRTILIHRTDAHGHGRQNLLASPNIDDEHMSGFFQLEARAKLMKEDTSDSWPPLLIFPEGTTTAGNGILRFHTSIFRLGISIQPVSIKYYSWMHTEYVGKNLFRIVMRKLYNPFCMVVVSYLDPITPSEEITPRALADTAGRRIASSLNIGYLPYTSEDGFYFRTLRLTSEKCTSEFLRDYGWFGTEDALNLKQDLAFTNKYRLPKGPTILDPEC